jgi:Flp pilus assembly protein TadG
MNWNRLRRPLSALAADLRGGAAVEFALVAPLLILLYAVGFEITEAATVNRKLTDTTVQLSEVISQYTKVNKNDISTLMNATSQIMAPYSTSYLSMTVSEITVDANGVASVTWSEPYQNGTAFTGTPITTAPAAPPSFATANSSYVVVQSSYTYSPIIGANLINSMVLSQKSFMLPRNSSSVACTDC